MIKLRIFNSEDLAHLELLEKIKRDQDIQNNASSICFPNEMTYVIKVMDLYVGLIKIIENGLNYSIEIGLLDMYRNCGFGQEATKLAVNIISNLRYDKITLQIDSNNSGALVCAHRAGFLLDNEECQDSSKIKLYKK